MPRVFFGRYQDSECFEPFSKPEIIGLRCNYSVAVRLKWYMVVIIIAVRIMSEESKSER